MTGADRAAVTIAAPGGLSATISPTGAELQRLVDARGRDLLWNGDPAVWAGRAPILFPVVGAVAGGVIRVDGRDYPMPKHGIARHRPFALAGRTASSATFRLAADDETRAAYPFDFVLEIAFAIAGQALTMTATIANPGDRPLPASFGFHPALCWPLPYGRPRAAHHVRFERPEAAPVRRLDKAGLVARSAPSPVSGRDLPLDDALFTDDAIIFDQPVSRRLTYGARGGPQLEICFPDLPMLALWTKPGAGFLCIEPWQGHADPAGFAGAFADKPGSVTVEPGAERRFTMRIAVLAPDA